jgi:hypothetical protein
MRDLALMITLSCALCACDEQPDPVDIPFEGIDPSAEAKRPAPLPPPPASTSAPPPAAPAVPAGLGAVQACCAALRADAQNAKDEGTRAVNKQAAAVCSQRAQDVRVGRMTKSQALSAVRGSLLGAAPGACR